MWLQESTFIREYKISQRGFAVVERRCRQLRFKDDMAPFVLQEAECFAAAYGIQIRQIE